MRAVFKRCSRSYRILYLKAGEYLDQTLNCFFFLMQLNYYQ